MCVHFIVTPAFVYVNQTALQACTVLLRLRMCGKPTYICIRTLTCKHTHIHMRSHTHTRTRTNTHTYTHTHAHTHLCTCQGLELGTILKLLDQKTHSSARTRAASTADQDGYV